MRFLRFVVSALWPFRLLTFRPNGRIQKDLRQYFFKTGTAGQIMHGHGSSDEQVINQFYFAKFRTSNKSNKTQNTKTKQSWKCRWKVACACSCLRCSNYSSVPLHKISVLNRIKSPNSSSVAALSMSVPVVTSCNYSVAILSNRNLRKSNKL